MSFIEWRVEVDKKEVTRYRKFFVTLDKATFHNPSFSNAMWNSVAKKIGKFIESRFKKRGPGWKPLSDKYAKWKLRAVSRGKTIEAGQFGKRLCKMTQMGRLTNTLFPSATIKNKDANIFEVKDIPGMSGGSFRYAISLDKLPYAKSFNDKRPFFYLSDQEANEVMEHVAKHILAKIDKVK